MSTRSALVPLVALALAASLAHAQPLPATALANHVGQWLRFEIVGGEIVMQSRRGAGSFSHSFSSRSTDREERFEVSLRGQFPTLNYSLTSPDERLEIRIHDQSEVQIRRFPRGQGTVVPCVFLQSAGRVRFGWGSGDAEQERRAAGLWHLALSEPEACRQHLFPLLAVLRRDWKLDETCAELTERLVKGRLRHPLPRARWAALVADLGDQRFAVRQAADAELRRSGQAARAYLESLSPSTLDAEQRYRIRGIIAELSRAGRSSEPETLAAWLAADPRIWLALLSSDEAARRETAREQLELLLDEPVDFDPHAEPAVREKQIAVLRLRLEPEAAQPLEADRPAEQPSP